MITALEEAQHTLAGAVPSHLWEHMTLTAPHNLHITLKYMGYQERFLLKPLHTHLSGSRFQSFPLTLQGIGSFQFKNQAYLWAGLKKSDALVSFQNNLDQMVAQHLGLPLKGTFTPHITLMRLKGTTTDELNTLLRRAPKLPAYTFTSPKFYLYQTENDSNGHKVYLPEERYSFR